MARRPLRQPLCSTAFAALLCSPLAAPIAWGQTTTPNWGAKGPATQPFTSPPISPPVTTPVTTSTSKSAAATTPSKAVASPALEALLKRPDTDVVTAPDGKRATVGEIRQFVARRRAIVDALHAGKLPPGWKYASSAPKVSPSRAELLSASTVLRDASHAEAQAAITQHAAAPVAYRPPAAAAEQAFTPSSLRTHTAREPVGAQNLPLNQPIKSGIFLINRKSSGVQVTPGGQYAINGLGFGAATGQVELSGKQLPSGRLPLRVTSWSDGLIVASLPEPVRGIADQPVSLRVVTQAHAQYTHDAQFYATREELSVSSDQGTLPLDRAFKIRLSDRDQWQTADVVPSLIGRSSEGRDLNCPDPGNDSLTLTPPAGWALAEVSVQTPLPTQSTPDKDMGGSAGDTVVTSNYAVVGWTPNFTSTRLTVHWGVFRSHSSSGGVFAAYGSPDFCGSIYSVQAKFIGPAGLKPY